MVEVLNYTIAALYTFIFPGLFFYCLLYWLLSLKLNLSSVLFPLMKKNQKI